jgi:riboflavin synthase
MFTGLIETVGSIASFSNRGDYRILRIHTADSFGPVTLGESISCDGACLTVTGSSKGEFVVEASSETISRTTLSSYTIGSTINLERALQAGGHLGGHFVTGHVDTVGEIERLRQVGESWELVVRFDKQYDLLVVEKGSIAISGVSLTVNTADTGKLSVNVIPFTLQATNLGKLTAGTRVNLEFDLLGKYILKATGARQPAGLSMDKLLSSGW